MACQKWTSVLAWAAGASASTAAAHTSAISESERDVNTFMVSS